MKDFIIVGSGLAANVLMHSFKKHNISFVAIGKPELSNCSRIAAGIWNPLVFKRSTKSWLAEALIPALNEFYTECESAFGKKIITQRPIAKPFTEEQEKNLWRLKSQTELADFMDETIYNEIPENLVHCHITNGYGLVKQAGNLNMTLFLDQSIRYFKDHFIFDEFDHKQLQIQADQVNYQSVTARQIVFCEGYLVKNNPFFSWIPLKPAKGEILTIAAPALKLNDYVFNKNGFLMGAEDVNYRVGATYEWQVLNDSPSEKGLMELRSKLAVMADCDYSIIKHEAGVRPSSIDRRPIIGRHPQHHNLFVFNGLGTKGVMLAPYFAKKFVNFYLQKEMLNPEVDLSRFYHFYEA